MHFETNDFFIYKNLIKISTIYDVRKRKVSLIKKGLEES